ncbi:MAG: hypothetical protein GY909_05725 [Oligoflexia bacterium]|nr:hypothetical protein [Oligoflexia bacterium]
MKSLLKKSFILITFMALFLASCGEEQVKVKNRSEVSSSNPVSFNTIQSCAAFSLVKPKVDFLFLWDNSTSSAFINSSTRSALNNTINQISNTFDYHIMIAPLIGTGNNEAKFISETPDGLSSSALSIKIDRSLAAQSLNFTYAQGNQEKGVTRAIDLIKSNINNGIFRPNSYLAVVVMSNEDDNFWAVSFPEVEAERTAYVSQKLHELNCLRGNYNDPQGRSCTGANLNLNQLRFMSIVAYSGSNSCPTVSYSKQNLTYKEISSRVYSTPYTNGTIVYDNETRSDLEYDQFLKLNNYDSYNICNISDFSKIFDGINSSITDQLIQHEYNFWPVASPGASFNPDQIKVVKNGVEYSEISFPVSNGQSGYTYSNVVQTVNTRYAPTPGEPFTGYVVQLHGDARVKYPDCIQVTTQTPTEFFGYINLQNKPFEGSIVVKIDGQTIPQGGANGWELVKENGQPKYYNSFNIKIQGPGNYNPGTPAVNKSGYFIKLNGNAIYSNGSQIEVSYDPLGT